MQGDELAQVRRDRDRDRDERGADRSKVMLPSKRRKVASMLEG